jgi:hypothetical protein
MPSPQNVLLAFAAQVRTGIFGKGQQNGHQLVEKALQHVAQTLQLGGYDEPRKMHGTKELDDLPFQHLLKSYRDLDPPQTPTGSANTNDPNGVISMRAAPFPM